MEEFGLVRCDSLDTASSSDKEPTTRLDNMSLCPEVEPSPAELAQCEAEVGTLLSIIAEVNKKMGSLKAPSEPGDLRPPRPPSPLFPDLLSHRLVRSIPEKKTASDVKCRRSLPYRGGCSVMWAELKGALAAVEDSINYRRSWAAPITSSDREKPKEHLRAAQDSWAKATKILEEMEKEFGISCPSDVAKETFQEDVSEKRIDAHPAQADLGELQGVHSISQVEGEKSKVGQQRAWRSAISSPPYRSAGTTGALSTDRAWSSFPNSPLLLRRAAGGSLSSGGDCSPLSFVTSGSPSPSPVGLESEIERLNRYNEKLKSRNERLTVALERRRAECEHLSVTLKRFEADCSAMHLALRYCEECEEAYSELLSLYDAQRQQSIPLQTSRAGVEEKQQPGSPSQKMGGEELSTSFTIVEVTREMETHKAQRTPEVTDREVALRQLIEQLKRDRAAIYLHKPRPHQAEVKMSPDAGHSAGMRVRHVSKDNSKSGDESTRDKTSLFHELITAREEMSDLRALIRLKEKELRCLQWSVVAQKAQEGSEARVPESLREELGGCKAEQQRLCENAAKVCNDGDVAGLRTRPILKELHVLHQREQALKKRLASVYDSLNATLPDSASNSRDSDEHVSRIAQAHSKALSSYRHIRRRYREQVWKLEHKLAAMMESQHIQSEMTTAGEDSEWRREETVL
ncbi:harmonin-binding protein USHBP1 [Syngnathoides biaculeatus]|uniref:harmonin-binding protein USHBP1 n=1 Tax=Syngnathoides biaculeatus TaxID=300417 RepID=UPI002ADDCC56|nr:harmonin-binding protein USHBP1 [Syngnathoides biaculeatus]XP_061680837.1 harmonin-binding protein USHBP1 [Syngnathoides biaculeatus]XP_061680838.1 harmonin-binding protein USHBP1 [Syngnathoides biaculeatus]